MEPIFIRVYGFEIRSYGFILALVLAATYVALLFDYDILRAVSGRLEELLTTVVLAALFGARLLFFIQNGFPSSLSEFVNIHDGGLSGQGAVIFGILSLLAATKILKLRFLKITDAAAPYALMLQGLGRISCMFEGCCFGRPAPEWLPRFLTVVYTKAGGSGPLFQRLVHVQAIHAAVMVSFAAFLFFFRRKWRRSLGTGVLTSLYLIFEGLIRGCCDFLRGSRDLIGQGPISWSQIAAALPVLLGLLLLFYSLKRRQTVAD